jgi:hypothetical protein
MLRTALPRSALSSELPIAFRAVPATPTAAQRSFTCASRRSTGATITCRPPQRHLRHPRVPSEDLSNLRFTTRAFTNTARMAASTRTESDAFGEIQVESDKYWGAQTQRSLGNFKINQPQDRMPPPIVRAFGVLKGAAATVNMKFGLGWYTQDNGERTFTANDDDLQIRSWARQSKKPHQRLLRSSSSTTSRSSSGKPDLALSRT